MLGRKIVFGLGAEQAKPPVVPQEHVGEAWRKATNLQRATQGDCIWMVRGLELGWVMGSGAAGRKRGENVSSLFRWGAILHMQKITSLF
jgi:hypothetical protein